MEPSLAFAMDFFYNRQGFQFLHVNIMKFKSNESKISLVASVIKLRCLQLILFCLMSPIEWKMCMRQPLTINKSSVILNYLVKWMAFKWRFRSEKIKQNEESTGKVDAGIGPWNDLKESCIVNHLPTKRMSCTRHACTFIRSNSQLTNDISSAWPVNTFI